MIFFFPLTQMAKHRANFHCLARLGWALSPPKEGKAYWGTDLNGVSKWCLNEPDLGTAGERFSNLPGGVGETQGCFFLHKLFRADSRNQVFLLLGSSLLWGTFLAFLLPSAGWVCGKQQLYPVQTPAWDEPSLHHCLWKSSQAALCCQGMMKVWALTSRLQEVQDMPCEGLPLSVFSSSVHCSSVSKPYQDKQGEEGGHWRFGVYLILGFTFCYHRGGGILHYLDTIHQKMPVTFLKAARIDEKKALLHQLLICTSPWDHDMAEQVL